MAKYHFRRDGSGGNDIPLIVVLASGCWMLTMSATKKGYGRCWVDGKTVSAHRCFWESFNGPIAKGYQIDHLCRFTRCVNPGHLEVVTSRENTMRGLGIAARLARQAECMRGHLLAGENLRINHGSRVCRACRKARDRSVAARTSA